MMITRTHKTIALLAGALLLLVGLAETLAQNADKPSRDEILERIPEEPDILINVRAYDMPATYDLMRLGNAATPALVNCLVNNLDERARVSCANVLVATRDVRAIKPLMSALDDPSDAVKSWAIDALAGIEARPATQKLLNILEQPYVAGYIKRDAIEALGRSGDPAAIEPLIAYFRENWDETAQRALWDMRRQLTGDQIRNILLIEPFNAPRDDVDWDVLRFAIEKAGDLQVKELVEPMKAYYEEASYDTKNRIVYNLGRIGDESAVPFIEGLIDPTGQARLLNNVTFALQRLNQDVAPLLREGLADERAYIRYNMAFVAGDLEDERMVPELATALEDINDIVRSEAAIALGKIGSADAIPALEKAATTYDNPIVRRDAFVALLQIDYQQFRDAALAELEKSEFSSVKNSLVRQLAEEEDRAIISDIMGALDPNNWDQIRIGLRYLDQYATMDNQDAIAWLTVRANDRDHEAIVLLSRFADPRTTFMYEQWILNPGGEQEQLVRGLGALKADKRKELIRPWLEKDRHLIQLYAAAYFTKIGEDDKFQVLLNALENAPVEFKETTAIILTRLNFRTVAGAEDALVALLDHRDVYTRLYAARSLAHWGLSEGLDHLWLELDKKIPFIRDEVLSIVRRLPGEHREPLLEDWMQKADPMLKMRLEEIAETTPPPV